MPILALDTSSAVAVAVLDDAGGVLASRAVPEQRRHAEQLAPTIISALTDAGVQRRDLTAVVVGTGPAPFTGLRVGLVTARVLALTLAVPAWGVSSLDALAAPVLRAAAERGEPDARVLVVTDARRREVYWAVYGPGAAGDVRLVAGPGVAHPEQLTADGLTAGVVVVGRGTALYAAALGLPEQADSVLPDLAPLDRAPLDRAPLDPAPLDRAPLDPDAAELGRLALGRAAAGVEQSTEALYLRRPDAVPTVGGKRVLP